VHALLVYIAMKLTVHTILLSIICYVCIICTQVVNLTTLSPLQLQKVLLKFAKELYILSKLQHPRVVTVYGCATTVEELTLVMEVSSNNCHANTVLHTAYFAKHAVVALQVVAFHAHHTTPHNVDASSLSLDVTHSN
jgi:Protein tyrosine and serine/threonine kinase